MYICRLVIRNFRSFTHLDLSLNPGVTVVVGENNTGKSNLLYAIRLAIDANLSSQFRNLTEQDFHSSIDIRQPQQVVISLEFTNYAGRENEEALVGPWAITDERARLTYRFRPRASVRESLEAGETLPGSLTLDDYHWEIAGSGEVDPATIAWNDDVGVSVKFSDLQYFSVMFLHALRDVQQDLRQIRASPLGKLLSSRELPDDEKQELVGILQEANSKIAGSTSIREAGEAIETAFEKVAGEAFAMSVRLGMADPSFASISRALTLLLSDAALKDFEPYRNGLGLNNILYISMILEYFVKRISAAKTAGQVFLIEEPEAHLHPQLQRSLCGTLIAQPFQTILTTHSTHISSFVPIRSCVVLTKGPSAAIRSAIPAKSPAMTTKDLGDLGRYLDATRSTLIFARKVMLVEGPAELFLIPALVKKVMGKDLDRLGISVIPIYGVHFSVYGKLFSETALQKKCVIVADGDLLPSDRQPSEEPEAIPLTEPALESLANHFLRVFKCQTTFERALTLPGTLSMLASAATELGATITASRLQTGLTAITSSGTSPARKSEILSDLQSRVLSLARRVGKARFAQVASKYAELATELPQYIHQAVDWLEAE